MAFQSILFENPEDTVGSQTRDVPDFFLDLNLDQIVATITASKEEYDLVPFFYTPLRDLDQIEYRQEVMRDLSDVTLLADLKSFGQRMKDMRACLRRRENAYYAQEKQRWFLDAAELYCHAVNLLAQRLSAAHPGSRGLRSLIEYLSLYGESASFLTLLDESKALRSDLALVQYSILISGQNVCVQKYDSEVDYSAEVEQTFRKFQQGVVDGYLAKFADNGRLNHVEGRILECVARLFPDLFQRLDTFCALHADYLNSVIERFDQEIQFYISFVDYAAIFRAEGLEFCLPVVSDCDKETYADEVFDPALAFKLIGQGMQTIQNSFHLEGPERIIVVSGPNQGGKTTFARTFGQLHYLASLGCPVPGSNVRLFLFDRLFTHFEKVEKIENLHGKLQDDLLRIHSILAQASPNSIVIMNEIFSSTTLQDAIFLGERVMGELIKLDLIGVCVTFIDEFASLGEKVVSMASTVIPENPAERTFKIIRKPADGLAYAIAIAEKYGLTYASLKERLVL